MKSGRTGRRFTFGDAMPENAGGVRPVRIDPLDDNTRRLFMRVRPHLALELILFSALAASGLPHARAAEPAKTHTVTAGDVVAVPESWAQRATSRCWLNSSCPKSAATPRTPRPRVTGSRRDMAVDRMEKFFQDLPVRSLPTVMTDLSALPTFIPIRPEGWRPSRRFLPRIGLAARAGLLDGYHWAAEFLAANEWA